MTDFSPDRRPAVFVAGHRGLAGSAIVRRLKAAGFDRFLTRTRAELDLRDQTAVRDFFAREKPEYVFLAAAHVGGIHANNTYRADFIIDNLQIETNVIQAAHASGVKRLLFLGSSCAYPRKCPQPMTEDHLLTGTLEATNEPYAIAKIAGIALCRAYNSQHGTDFFSVMPTNLYGPGDNFDLQNSHVLPALIRKVHEAKERGASEVEVWGTGDPLREFLHVDDMADACVFLMSRARPKDDLVNIGSGQELTIRALAEAVREAVGFKGALRFDKTKPDGTPRKLLDVSRLRALGWTAKIPLKEGLLSTYQWYEQNVSSPAVRRP